MRQQKTTGEQRWVLGLPLIVAGCGVSMAMPAAQSAGVASLPRESVGTVSGIYAMLRQLGGVAGVAVTAAAFAGAGGYASFSAEITRAMVVCGVLSLAGALTGLGITARRTVEVRV